MFSDTLYTVDLQCAPKKKSPLRSTKEHSSFKKLKSVTNIAKKIKKIETLQNSDEKAGMSLLFNRRPIIQTPFESELLGTNEDKPRTFADCQRQI